MASKFICAALFLAFSCTLVSADCGSGQVLDGTDCKYCNVIASGNVKQGSTCVPAHTGNDPTQGPCDADEFAAYGVCTSCGSGRVSLDDGSNCAYCSADTAGCSLCGAGKVKGLDENGKPTCVASHTDNNILNGKCQPDEFAAYGVCTACGTGRVSNPDGSNCVYCSDNNSGNVKDNTHGTCVPAQPYNCKNDEFAAYGVCTSCGTGRVSNDDGNGCAYCNSDPGANHCLECGPGKVKVGIYCAPSQPVVEQYCDLDEFAAYGVCTSCGTGRVSNADGSSCEYCSSATSDNCPQCGLGKVKGQGDDSHTCVASHSGNDPTSGPCDPDEFAAYGVCTSCGTGRVSVDDGSHCAYCSDTSADCSLCGVGKVKVLDGSGLATCESSSTACSSDHFAAYGVCTYCGPNRHANDAGNGCVNN